MTKHDAMIRVLCVDDHEFLAQGLEARLEVEPDIEFVGHITSADELPKAIKDLQPDIVLLDIEMPGADSFEAIDSLKRRHPDVRCIMLSAYVRDHYLDTAYKAGAWGYLSKGDSSEAVVAGIRNVAKGHLAFSDEVKRRAVDTDRKGGSGSRLSSLTEREGQILRLIAKGLSRTDIAEQICRSPMTVDNHRKSIMRKLEINDRTELVRFAIAEGLVEI